MLCVYLICPHNCPASQHCNCSFFTDKETEVHKDEVLARVTQLGCFRVGHKKSFPVGSRVEDRVQSEEIPAAHPARPTAHTTLFEDL